jgi:hypothetical protein
MAVWRSVWADGRDQIVTYKVLGWHLIAHTTSPVFAAQSPLLTCRCSPAQIDHGAAFNVAATVVTAVPYG